MNARMRESRYYQLAQAVEAADKLTKEVIMPDLWPTGHRVGSVVLEINIHCQRAENHKVAIVEIIQRVARQKNK